MNLEEIKEVSRLLMRANEANPDPNTSQAVASGILLALLARTRTGSGQAVEVTMLQANVRANADEALITTDDPLAHCLTINATDSMRFIASTKPTMGGSFWPVYSNANGGHSVSRRTARTCSRIPDSQAWPPAPSTISNSPLRSERFLWRTRPMSGSSA